MRNTPPPPPPLKETICKDYFTWWKEFSEDAHKQEKSKLERKTCYQNVAYPIKSVYQPETRMYNHQECRSTRNLDV